MKTVLCDYCLGACIMTTPTVTDVRRKVCPKCNGAGVIVEPEPKPWEPKAKEPTATCERKVLL